MPGNGFPFTIRVRRQIDVVCLSGGFGDGVYMLAVSRNDFILHGKIMFSIDRTRFGYQVAHMSIGRQYLKIFTQIFFQGDGFGRGFND